VLGIVENMSYFICPHCQGRTDIFAHGGAHAEAEKMQTPFLGEIPLDIAIRETSDAGTPVVVSEPDGPHAAIYRAIGEKVRDQLENYVVRRQQSAVITKLRAEGKIERIGAPAPAAPATPPAEQKK